MKFDSKVFFALCVVGSVILTGCNGIGSKDTLLAKFDNEAVYQEDLEMLLKNNANSKEPLNYMVYENLYSKAAIASKALSEFPEIKKEWEDYFKEINPRILMVVFQRFYAMELLTFSDSELRRFYTGNKQLFPNDTVGDYRKVRSEVAGAYYLYKNPEKFAAHLKENLGDSAATVTAEDSAKYRADFLEKYRGYLRDSIGSNIMNLQKISMQEPPTADAKAYYEKHHDEFMTAGGYELYQIQMSDSAALSNLFAETPTFEQFKALAFANDQNKVTAKDSGRVGVVKNYHCLPYEIGMMDSLFTVLEGKNAGFVTGVFKSVASKSFHRFYLVSKVKPELKPFERVEKGLVSAIASGQILDVDSSLALRLNDGKCGVT